MAAESLGAAPETKPVRISGIYPHLAVFNGTYDPKTNTWDGTGGECGIGAVVPWAGKLWLITYPPHETRGGRDKLWAIDESMHAEIRPESVGGTHASRMIHKESNQLIIGPYFIDAKGTVRAADVKTKLVGRMTAAARHLTDPANLVYFFDMEGAIYEVNVHTLAVEKLFAKPVPGWHGKGGYTGQGRLIIANNGERGRAKLPHLLVGGPPKERDEIGCLAEWDGTAWRIIERKQFLDVTGPGGIHGNPDGPAAGIQAPVWAIGWDRRSCILKLLDGGTWHTFRVPKASHAYDPAHGWYTEWPRIREVGEGKLLMDLHGMFFDFPKGFRAGQTGGLVPVASHLRYIPDFCDWNGTLVLAADEASAMANPMCGKSQSNLWFGSWDDLKHFGPRSGWGGPWLGDAVKAGEASDPFLVSGFDHLCLHLSINAPANMPPAGVRTTGRFPITELPDELAGLTCVTIARGNYLEPAPGYSFSVNQNVTVYLAVDDRGTPDLGTGWKKTALRMQWGGSYTDTVYAKPFPRGRVDIPGRSDTHGAAKHYAVPNTCFLRPEGAEAVALKVADLPVKLGGRATRPAPIVPRVYAPRVYAPRRGAAEGMAFALEVDRKGDGRWANYKTIAMPESGYAWHVFPHMSGPQGFQGAWVRLKATKAGRATAYFHCTSARPQKPNEAALFASLPAGGTAAPVSTALIRPASHNTRLQVLAQTVGADGTVRDAGYWEVDAAMAYHRMDAAGRAPGRIYAPRRGEVSKVCAVKQDFTVDAASAIMTWKGRRYRLPKGDAAFDKPFATGWPRGIREVQSERYLANIHGTFYEMPRDTGVPHLKPACTHNRRIVDYCSWRGLLVLSGARQAAKPDGNYFASADGTVGLWFGAVDDLWKLGKPVGRGGPWRDTPVVPGTPSDPYLMTGYDKKRVELSHDAAETVTFTLEVDVDHQGWNPYATVAVPAGKTVTHEFPTGYSAHWVRVKSSHACEATATFVYE